MSVLLNQGTNTGAKEHSAGIKGTMNMDTASSTLIYQSKLKAKELDAQIYSDYQKQDKVWSDSPTSNSLTTCGEGLMKAMRERAPNYTAKRIGDSTFEVNYTPLAESDAVSSTAKLAVEYHDQEYAVNVPLPLFKRTRIVQVSKDGTLTCSCCHFEVSAGPCEHQQCVCETVYSSSGRKFNGEHLWLLIAMIYHNLPCFL